MQVSMFCLPIKKTEAPIGTRVQQMPLSEYPIYEDIIEYVVVLSGDYLQNGLFKIVQYHKEKNASCTIAVYEVPMKAPRWNLNTNPDSSIYEFEGEARFQKQ